MLQASEESSCECCSLWNNALCLGMLQAGSGSFLRGWWPRSHLLLRKRCLCAGAWPWAPRGFSLTPCPALWYARVPSFPSPATDSVLSVWPLPTGNNLNTPVAAEVVFSVHCILFQITFWSFLVLCLFQTCSKNSNSVGTHSSTFFFFSPHVCNFS